MSWPAHLVDLALPRRCVGCGAAAPGHGLCPACTPGGLLVRTEVGGLSAVAAARYEGAVRAALLHYKERGRRDLAGPLGELLARAVRGLLTEHRATAARGGVVLVPVPSSRAAAAGRGGAHVLRLARRAGRRSLLAVANPLVLTRSVRDSAGLGPAERARNLAAAMSADPPWPGALALVVDDIVTTGATLREARRALAAAGWEVLGAATVAVTPRRPRQTPGGSGTDDYGACPPIGVAQVGGLA